MTRVLVVSTEKLGEAMPGPGIRAWHLADVLAEKHDVTLASTVGCDRASPRFTATFASATERSRLERSAQVIVVTAGTFHDWPEIAGSDRPVVVDLYDPYHLENLEPGPGESIKDRAARVARMSAGIGAHLRRGDFFLCATDRQRDFWLGSLAESGRLSPFIYDSDPTFERFVGLVPFGIPSDPPVRSGPGLRRVMGLAPEDEVVLWAGGVYNWFDPLTLLQAVAELAKSRPRLRLVFMGMAHPNPAIPAMRTATEARDNSDRLGLTGRVVFFNEGWVPYDERADFLLDADVGVSTHLDHVETRFSFRTRVLDYLWAGIPMVLTEGDSLSELVAARGLGLTVPPGDVSALERALETALSSPRPGRDAFDPLRRQLTWESVARPLVDFCNSPVRAADLPSEVTELPPTTDYTPPVPPGSSLLRSVRERAIGSLMRHVVTQASEETVRQLSSRIGDVERVLGDQGDASDEVAETIGRTLTRLSSEVDSLAVAVDRLSERLDRAEEGS